MRGFLAGLLLSIAAFTTCVDARSQDDQKAPEFGTRVEAITVNVLAMTSSGRPIKGLKKEDFRIFEDGIEQEIETFYSDEAPFGVGLLLDTSTSTEGKLSLIQRAAVSFVELLHPQDEVMVISFDDEVYLDTEFTRNRNFIDRAIRGTRTGQSTQLYDAVYVGLEQIEETPLRRVMVLFSDGVDTTSADSSGNDTIELAKETDAIIYTVYFDTERDELRRLEESYRNPGRRAGGGGLGTPPTTPGKGPPISTPPIGNPLPIPTPSPRLDPRSRRDLEIQKQQLRQQYQVARNYLRRLAEAGGGNDLKARGDVSDLEDAFAQIADDLRSLYTIAYRSTNTDRDGKFRKLKVKIERKGAKVRAREGYFARKSKP